MAVLRIGRGGVRHRCGVAEVHGGRHRDSSYRHHLHVTVSTAFLIPLGSRP